jgi:hypothetical protein
MLIVRDEFTRDPEDLNNQRKVRLRGSVIKYFYSTL